MAKLHALLEHHRVLVANHAADRLRAHGQVVVDDLVEHRVTTTDRAQYGVGAHHPFEGHFEARKPSTVG